MKWLNFGLRKSPRNLPFFINLSKKKDIGRFFPAIYIIYGLVTNPNITKEQFLDLYYSVSEHEQNDVVLRFVDAHPKRDILKWTWEFQKKQPNNNLGKYWVGQRIIRHLDETDELRREVIEHYKGIRDEMFYNETLNKDQCIIEYDFFLEYMIANEVNMQSYDEYVQSYYFRKKQIKEDIDYFFYTNLAKNRDLDDARIVNLYNISKNYDEYFRMYIFMNLLQCKNITEELFFEILDYRKKSKNQDTIRTLYAGAAKNQTHINKIFEIVFKYLENAGKRPVISKRLVFEFMVSNPALSKDQLDRIIGLLESWVMDGTVSLNESRSLDHLIWKLFESEYLKKDQIINVFSIYLNYLDKLSTYYKKLRRESSFIFLKAPKLYLDDEIFDMVLQRTSDNLFQQQMLMWFLDNENLSRKQFEVITSIMEPKYFKGDTYIYKDIAHDDDLRDPDNGLLLWASSKFVTNL